MTKKNDLCNNFIIIKDADKRRNIKHDDTVFIPFILLNVKNIHPSSILSKDKSLVDDQIDFVFVRGVSQNISSVLLDKFDANVCIRNGNMNTPLLNDGSSASDLLLYTGPNKHDFFCDIFKLTNTQDILNKKVSILAHFKVLE